MALALLDMADNASDDIGIGDCANHAKFATASGTELDVDTENAVESRHPGHRRGGRLAGLCPVLAGEGRRDTMSDPPIYLHDIGPPDELGVDPFNLDDAELGRLVGRLHEELTR